MLKIYSSGGRVFIFASEFFYFLFFCHVDMLRSLHEPVISQGLGLGQLISSDSPCWTVRLTHPLSTGLGLLVHDKTSAPQ